jgi:hypothetical protein
MTKKTTSLMVLIAGLLLAGAAKTAAQTPLMGKLFVNVSGGGQTQARTVDNSGSLALFNQTASWTTSESVPSGGLFDISVGYKVWHDFGLALGYSQFGVTGAAVGSASVPSPISFSQPATQVAINEVPTVRKDRNVYLVAMWFFPVKPKIDVAIMIGPSFTRVKQDLIVDSQAFRQNIVSAASAGTTIQPIVGNESGTAKGINVGVDGQYMFTKMIGAGAFIRYNGGTVDLADATGLNAGGFQLGIGGRFRF